MRKTIVAIVWCVLTLSAAAAPPRFLNQNWSDADRQWFYTTPQGSKLIPYRWALALERNDGSSWIESLGRFGFLPNPVSSTNPNGLPVGVVRDDDHLGLTCAACHTNQVEFKEVAYRVDGGPGDVELWAFLMDLGDVVKATAQSPTDPRFLRFAKRVLEMTDGPEERANLYQQLKAYEGYYTKFIAASQPMTAWGRARIDAFGMIFNRVTSIDLNLPQNSCRPNAPVSIPFVWDSSWQSHVQWNAGTPNEFAIERLARNVGEVLGVFAEIEIDPPKISYPSTAKRLNLIDLEDRIADLRSPKWQPEFGAIDETKAQRGKEVYRQQCIYCHAIVTPGKRQDVAAMDVGSDQQMAFAADRRVGNPGVLINVPKFIFFGPKFGEMGTATNPASLACEPVTGKTAPSGTMTFNAVIGAILSPTELRATDEPPVAGGEADADSEDKERDRLRQLLSGAIDDVEQKELESSLTQVAERKQQTEQEQTELGYKARPLDGIWATAPYLHNGSVPTLWDLLLPPPQRPATFHVGNRELDPVNVGFVTTAGPATTPYDTKTQGNTNVGHEYGTGLSEKDRWALIEYLKTL